LSLPLSYFANRTVEDGFERIATKVSGHRFADLVYAQTAAFIRGCAF